MPRPAPAMVPALAVLLSTAACAAGDATGDRVVAMRDSAGVTIVENTGPEVADSQVIRTLEEEIRIGVVDGDERYQLHEVYDLAVGSDGTIFVADNGSGTVRVYAADGSHVRDLGGRGAGPGEFPRMVNDVWVENDTVVALDWQGYGRVNAYGPDGALLLSMDRVRQPGSGMPRAGLPGRWIGAQRPTPDSAGTIRSAQLTMVDDSAFAPTGGPPLLEFPLRPLYRSDSGEGSLDWPLFTVEPALAVGPGDRIAYDAGHPYEYRVHDATGALQRIVRREWNAVPFTEDHFQRYRELQAAYYDSLAQERGARVREQQARAEQRTERQLLLPRPDAVPPLGRMLMGHDGAVWLERRDLGDVVAHQFQAMYGGFDDAPPGASRWDVFDAEGRFLHAVELPAGFAPFAATAAAVTGVLTDELGVQYVVRYRPAPGGGSAG